MIRQNFPGGNPMKRALAVIVISTCVLLALVFLLVILLIQANAGV